MRKRRKLIRVLVGCGVVVVLILAFGWQREPQYDGRRLSEWVLMQGYVISQNDPSTKAIQEIGTNALPCLLKWVQYRPGPPRRFLYSVLNRLPLNTRLTLLEFFAERGPQLQDHAWVALLILGPKAKPAIPTLEQLAHTQNPYWPVVILASIGEEGGLALGEMATNQTNSAALRLNAIDALGGWPERWTSNAQIKTALMSCLHDPNVQISARAAKALRKLPSPPPEAFSTDADAPTHRHPGDIDPSR